MKNFNSETEYSLNKDLQWGLLNKRLNSYGAQIREFRLYTFIAMLVLIFLILFGNQGKIINLLLSCGCLLWGLTFAYSTIISSKYISISSSLDILFIQDHSEGFFRLMNEMKFYSLSIQRDLKKIQLLTVAATCYTLISILSFVIENYIK